VTPVLSTSAHFQPDRPLIDQLVAVLAGFTWTNLDIPVAYAVTGGVRLLEERLSQDPSWPTVQKRFLVGIDWCRSDPVALDAIAAFPAADLRIVNGAELVEIEGCRPTRSYHPKAFIFSKDWPSTTGVIGCFLGSGNLSRNGLSYGHELDIWTAASSSSSPDVVRSLADIYDWFERLWSRSTKYSRRIRDQYRSRFEATQRRESRATTDDDSVPSVIVRQRGLKPDDLVVLRSFDNLWVDAGSMYSNLGRGRPGNQLELKRYTRVFFGFPARDLPPNSAIGGVDIVVGSAVHPDRHLRYGDNQMDKLDLPVPGYRAPADYRNETLLFTRMVAKGGKVRYQLKLARHGERTQWRSKSRRASTLFKFGGASNREFGVF
jgi:HKD family nuclease